MDHTDESTGVPDEVSPEREKVGDQQQTETEQIVALTTIPDSPADLTPAGPSAQAFDSPQAGPREPGVADAQLLTRVLVGLLASGSEELVQRLRDLEQEIDTYPAYVESGKSVDGDSTYDLLRYLALGLLMRGQRTAIRGARNGFYLSLGTASWFFDKIDGLTDNRLMRPFRRPFTTRLRRMGQTTSDLIVEGKHEERVSRTLGTQALYAIIDDIVDAVSENPEVTRMIQEVVGGQGVGLATVMRDNARQLSMTSDDAVEGVLRRLLRRTPRRALPPSPLGGQPQTMYSIEMPEEQKDDDEQ
jgi:hypothetical protein